MKQIVLEDGEDGGDCDAGYEEEEEEAVEVGVTLGVEYGEEDEAYASQEREEDREY